MNRAIRWLRWSRSESSGREGRTYVHAFLVDADGRIGKSVCNKRPPPEVEVVEIAPGEPDRCFACDDELRTKGRYTRRKKRDTTRYEPRYTFDRDWEKRP